MAEVDRETIEAEIRRLGSGMFQRLRFPDTPLESRFEVDTARGRSYRLWIEGLFAILILNGCLLVDYLLVKDPKWQSIVLRTLIVTPLALAINLLVRSNPRRWLREGSVAVGTTIICIINLFIQGNRSAETTTYGLICVLITVLFVDVVMRVRMPYAATATVAMSAAGLFFLGQSTGLGQSEKVVAASLLAIGVAITMTASHSLEREERLGYLHRVRSEAQSVQLSERNSVLQQLSSVDKLTGLPNRRAFEEQFETLWAEGERSHTPLSALLVDVDRFKNFNDHHGHLHGDKVLQHVAGLLLQSLRGQGEFVARFGGEEFVVLLPNTGIAQAIAAAEQIRSLVEASGRSGGHQLTDEVPLWPTISCGVAMRVPRLGVYQDDLLKAADRALYDAKAKGRNCVCCLEENVSTRQI